MSSRSFAFIVEGDVFMTLTFNEISPVYDRLSNACANNPIIIETTDLNIDPKYGWAWDGNTFINLGSE